MNIRAGKRKEDHSENMAQTQVCVTGFFLIILCQIWIISHFFDVMKLSQIRLGIISNLCGLLKTYELYEVDNKQMRWILHLPVKF